MSQLAGDPPSTDPADLDPARAPDPPSTDPPSTDPPSTDPPSLDLARYARNVYSQCGEDGIIEAVLERLPERDGWCVEFGAWDGEKFSNTAHLVEQGAHAVLIEGDARRCRALTRRSAANPRVTVLNAMVGWGAEDSLDTLLDSTDVPLGFDLLSIDIDGTDYHVWEAVRTYRPKVVVIEFNPTIPNGVDFVQAADPDRCHGASISSLDALARRKGYRLAATTEYNAFFVLAELWPGLGLRDDSVSALRTDTSWQATVFFGFDGHALLRGGRGLAWHGLPTPEDVRLVPRVFDGFPARFGLVRRGALRLWSTAQRRRTGRRGAR